MCKLRLRNQIQKLEVNKKEGMKEPNRRQNQDKLRWDSGCGRFKIIGTLRWSEGGSRGRLSGGWNKAF